VRDGKVLRVVCPCTVGFTASQEVIKRIPEDLPFSIPVDNVTNLRNLEVHRVVDLDLEGELAVIDAECASVTDDSNRVPPLAFCRLARGGKTTFLIKLFVELRKNGYTPIVANFNSGFFKYKGETHLQAVLRSIGLAFVSSPLVERERVICNETRLMEYIEAFEASEKGQASRGIVLLADELNQIDSPLDEESSKFLKAEFLDKAKRYLVFTSHVFMDVEGEAELDKNLAPKRAKPSIRGVHLAHLPVCTDVETLRKAWQPKSNALTRCEVALYGGIPGLIRASLEGSFNIRHRYERGNVVIAQGEAVGLLEAFVRALRTGDVSSSLFRFFMFSSAFNVGVEMKLKWPVCYIAPILDCPPFFKVHGIYSFDQIVVQPLITHAKDVSSGKAWEIVVRAGILINALDASLNSGVAGPFGIAQNLERPAGKLRVVHFTLPEEVRTIEVALERVKLALSGLGHHVLMVVSFSYGNFPELDGIIWLQSGSVCRKFGYQAKMRKGYPGTQPPSELDDCFLVRGDAPSKANYQQGWKYMSRDEVKELLGFSLESLIPSQWPEAPGST
jgi:hypothetical protein